ncbi:acyl-CoA dehydrogenase [Mycobacterium sp. SMC-8]|uniref:acyl-CoA dehydrogenase family protein n=1 Tax=Mycobacterium sp. SMC-8 TaxID=2857060 RepID=UPI0021B1FEE6|nr:acyl-CoA dehydrogenase family protein [Mycobacterium sp. SMC-8]UXA11556.1 acyl-CoA dehydrogenase [Mycobacterium sp. SMC-8]
MLSLSPEQRELARAEQTWLEQHDPVDRIRACIDTAPITVDPRAAEHAETSGLLSLLTPDGGGEHCDLAVLTEAHGRAASSLPIADVAIAQWLLATAQQHSGADSLPDDELIGVALLRPTGPTPVPMAADMTALMLVGHDESGDYAAVLRDSILQPMSTLDLSRSWARIEQEAADHQRVSLPDGTADLVADALALHRAWDALGAASRLFEMTVTYAGQRKQFGALIGSFQAVKHHCANMAIAVEASRAVLWSASQAIDSTTAADSRKQIVSSAVAYAKNAASDVASTALQVHGGIGFTWEHDLHLFLRRIKVDRAMNGTVESHRAALVPV